MDGVRQMKIAVLDADNLGKDITYELYDKWGEVAVYPYTSPEELHSHADGCDVLIFNKIRFTAEALDGLPHLKLLCVCATGYDNIDVGHCKKKGIAVCNVPAYSTQSVAQHTMALTLGLMHHVVAHDAFIKSGEYSACGRQTDLSRTYHEIEGKQWGIIGMGQIGRKVAELASAFGAKVCYYSTTGANRSDQYPRCELEEILRRSDILSIHSPKTPMTDGMIGQRQLALMKQDALIINVGRGGIVQEAALAQALRNKTIGGAAIDVFATEPLAADHPFLQKEIADRILLSPHVAWASVESRKRLMVAIDENIAAFVGGDTKNRVDI